MEMLKGRLAVQRTLYPREITEASRSALLELGIALRQYHDDIVLTGGWAPYYLTKDYFQHCGSMDIDLALKTEIMPRYKNIRDILESLGYVEENPFRFKRTIRSHIDGKDYNIELDLLCERAGAQYVNGLCEVQEALKACVFDGVSLAFDFNFEQEIEAYLPNDGISKATVKVTDLVGSLALKGNALFNRGKPKDSYDIFALTHYNGGPTQAVEYFNSCLRRKQISVANVEFIKIAIARIAYGFQSENHRGPFEVEAFSEYRYKRNIVAAYVNEFLKGLKPI
jgi:predicted nucleotidyltransferase component of viral defense system